MYLAAFLALAFTGAGRLSLDGLIWRFCCKRSQKNEKT
jgi:uncharacterized membrane protein YphA (DoxX/SURF4 family)